MELTPALVPDSRPAEPQIDNGRSEGGEGCHLRRGNLLVILQVAFALILLVGAGLMVKSFWRLRHVEPGLDPRGVLTLRLDLPDAKYTTQQARSQFMDGSLGDREVLEDLAAVASAPPERQLADRAGRPDAREGADHLVHSMASSGSFEEADRQAARSG
jgi:putative ABC transport system permease protein